MPGTFGQTSAGGGGGGVSRHEGNLCENVGNLSHIELALVLAAVKLTEKVRIRAAKTKRTATGTNDAPAFFIDNSLTLLRRNPESIPLFNCDGNAHTHFLDESRAY